MRGKCVGIKRLAMRVYLIYPDTFKTITLALLLIVDCEPFPYINTALYRLNDPLPIHLCMHCL